MEHALALARALAEPSSATRFDAADWVAILTIAHVERLSATLAYRLAEQEVPDAVRRRLDAAQRHHHTSQVRALWEVEMMRRALTPHNVPVVLLKGAAYAAAGLSAGQGRLIGDLDILVPRDALSDVEQALLAARWEWVKPDAYDDAYYRRWMHELPPLIHRDRDAIIDVHHTILPLTARPKPDAAALIANSVLFENGLRVLSPVDRVIHAAAHVCADGELDGGLRNLWDIHCLCEEAAKAVDGFYPALFESAAHHQLADSVGRALRLCRMLFETNVPAISRTYEMKLRDHLFLRRVLARDEWGRGTRPVTRFAFFVRSHLIRMPFLMLLRHLWTKWRMGRGAI